MDSLQKLHRESVQPHALVFPFPLVGHINPLLSISQVLASTYGFRITFLTTEYRLTQLKESKQKARDNPNIAFDAVPGLSDLSVNDHEGIPGVTRLFEAFRNIRESGAFEEWLQELHEKKGHPLSCVISDNLLSWTQPLADKMGIPRASFWASSATTYALLSQASLLLDHPDYTQATHQGENDVAMPLKVSGVHDDVPLSALPVEFTLRMNIPYMEMDNNCTWLMLNTSKHIESEPIQSIKVNLPNTKILAINVSKPLSFAEENCVLSSGAKSCNEHVESISTCSTGVFKNKEYIDCLDWLDLKPTGSVIYIAFGSIVSLEKEKLQELAFGLENSKKNFLWVLRSAKNSISNDDSINMSQLLPKGFVERTNGQGLIVSWAPQFQVLSHPAVGCFFTHCGWNSIMESLSCGVPLLALPPLGFADFTLLGWYIEHVWHVGLCISMEKLSKVEVEKVVKALMEEQRDTFSVYHENAKHMRKAFKLTTPQEELEPFVKEVMKRHTQLLLNYSQN